MPVATSGSKLLTIDTTPHGARRIARGEMWSGYSFTPGTYTHPLHQLAWLFRELPYPLRTG